jgi:hypothetical protein
VLFERLRKRARCIMRNGWIKGRVSEPIAVGMWVFFLASEALLCLDDRRIPTKKGLLEVQNWNMRWAYIGPRISKTYIARFGARLRNYGYIWGCLCV